MRGRIENILEFAKVRVWREGNPARWRGHLAHLLPRTNKVRQVAHHAAPVLNLVDVNVLVRRDAKCHEHGGVPTAGVEAHDPPLVLGPAARRRALVQARVEEEVLHQVLGEDGLHLAPLIKYVSRLSHLPLLDGNCITPLTTGRAAYDQMLAAIDALDTAQRGGPEPTAITLEAFGRPIPEA